MDDSPRDHADFDYMGVIPFDAEDAESRKLMFGYERMKVKKAIMPRIRQWKKDVKNKTAPMGQTDQKAFLNGLFREKLDSRHITTRYENGEIYPKDIAAPNTVFIQFPEPHVLITDLSDADENWYRLSDIIPDFANEAFLTYELGCWLASIASSINCCEYILKYEFLRNLKKEGNDSLLKRAISDNRLGLGSLIKEKTYGCLELLGIESFQDKLEYLNDVRVSIYHFNPDRAEKVSRRGQFEVEKSAQIWDSMVSPIVAFRTYEIMLDLINHFYSKKNALEYYEEAVADWKKKRKIK
jgi:hypothetical protein